MAVPVASGTSLPGGIDLMQSGPTGVGKSWLAVPVFDIEYYNFQRPHQSLQYATPARWCAPGARSSTASMNPMHSGLRPEPHDGKLVIAGNRGKIHLLQAAFYAVKLEVQRRGVMVSL